MSFEIKGRLTEIFETQQISEKFQKREFILETKETTGSGSEFVEYIKFQALQDKCSMLDSLHTDDIVKVSFNLKGRKWEKDGRVSYFTNLDAWRIEKEQSTNESPISPAPETQKSTSPDSGFPSASAEEPPANESGFDDLPF